MATERTYDYDYLRRLLREHPTWTHRQFAAAVTEHERVARQDPGYGPITVHAVASVLHRYRDTWTEQGDSIRVSKNSPTAGSQPFRNLPREHYYTYEIQALRTLGTIARGEPVSEKRRLEAERVVRRLTTGKAVIDVDKTGTPYVRPARADELDGEGNLFALTARYPGLTDLEWNLLETPEARAAASAHWRKEQA